MYAFFLLPFNVYPFCFEVEEQFLYVFVLFLMLSCALVCEKIFLQDNFTKNYIYTKQYFRTAKNILKKILFRMEEGTTVWQNNDLFRF